MTVATKLVVFFAILSLFRVSSVQALKECPFKSLYQRFQNSISMNHVNNNNDTTMLVTGPRDPDFFAQHQWIKNQVTIELPKEKRTGNRDYSNRDFCDKLVGSNWNLHYSKAGILLGNISYFKF
uniref:Uncharacterized protein n=1 Tax=Solanum lycopersicum TaxID=4081 RepID=A0A3Q7EJ50_SOLLC